MTKDTKSLPKVSARHLPYQEIVTPASARAVFWRPRYLRASGFLHHLPFLFWLVDLQRPAIVVALGVGDGVGYFGLCQAIDKLGEGARCHGLDGRPAAEGGPDREVLAYHEAQYGDFSRLSAEDPRDTVHRFEDGTVDLLLIDMALDTGLVQSLSHDWMRKLSARAVIVVHGTASRFTTGPQQGLLQGLTESHPTVRFETAEGLAAVLYGPDRLDKLERLAELAIGAMGHAEVHHVFSRLGAANHHECMARSEAARAEAALAQAEAAEQALSATRLTLTERERTLDQRSHAEDTRAEQLVTLQARLFELQTAHDARAEAVATHAKALAEVEANAMREAASRDAALIRERDRAEALGARLAQAEAAAKAAQSEAETARAELARATEAAAGQLAVKERALTLATERLEAARAAEAEARTRAETALAEREALQAAPPPVEVPPPASAASEQQHMEEIRVLTLRLEATQQEVLTLQKELRIRGDQGRRIKELETEIGELRRYNQELLSSTSWRITGPLRRVVRLVRPGR